MSPMFTSSDAETELPISPRQILLPSRLYPLNHNPSLGAFKSLCSRTTDRKLYPLASEISRNIPVYDLSAFDSADSLTAVELQDEWHHILLSGPGVFVLKNMYPSQPLLERVNAAFSSIIAAELEAQAESSAQKGDHFAASGKNSRIWNSFQKHAMIDPDSFVPYYSNPWLALVCDAWLGPAYRVTAQVNVVKPGGAPQVSHRDYHLGFQSAEACARFPKAMQIASQLLTLQGAVAHSDMPLESGPTRFLPFSQAFEDGYMAYRLPQFQDYFDRQWVSLPLEMGDGVFFNPALFHAAGKNSTDHVERSANLLQVSSAFGKPMESVDSLSIISNTWNLLRHMVHTEGLSKEVRAYVAAVAEGYPFPTNLDNRPPAPGGMAPESQQDIVLSLLRRDCTGGELNRALGELALNSQA